LAAGIQAIFIGCRQEFLAGKNLLYRKMAAPEIHMKLAAFLLALTAGAETLPLRDNWAIRSAADVADKGEALSSPAYRAQGWHRATVPSTVLAALVADGTYPDPFYGLNITKIPGYKEGRWLAIPKDSPFRSSWWFRTEFAVPESYAGRFTVLHLDGINYRANVWLNGTLIADATKVVGMFRRFEFPVQLHNNAKNVLAVEVIPPGLIPDRPYKTKQLEATTGWDDHNPQPPDANLGIWQDVYITATGPLALRHPYVATALELPSMDRARLNISAEVRNLSDREVSGELTGVIEDRRFSQPVRIGERERKVIAFPQTEITKPRVWWPVPLGAQELYDLRLTISVDGGLSDESHVRFGIREATTVINPEGWREYRINGRPLLIRGGAWMTSDMLLRFSPRRYEALVRYAAEAGLNMLRSEGFSIRETDEFYTRCDRYGVMVTQQIFGRNIPDEKLAVDCIEDMMLRIRNHPSLVHFLGHDETFPTKSLDRAYKDLIAKYIPDRTYQPHSGAFDVNERTKTGGTRTGTRELWTTSLPSHYYLKKEDGAWGFAQSGGIGGVFAPYESMKRMMPQDAMWPPFTPAWSLHTVIQGGSYFDALIKSIDTRYGKSSGIQEFLRKGLAQNYECARGMFEAYGRNKYSATGITTWKYDAAWPASPTWQYIDWYLIAGGAYYGAKRACEPLHVQYSYDDHSVWVVNMHRRAFNSLRVRARVLDFDLKERFVKTALVDVGEDAKAEALRIEWPKDISRVFFVHLTLEDLNGRVISDNRYWLSTVSDVPGKPKGDDGPFYQRAKSKADLSMLAKLPRTTLRPDFRFTTKDGEVIGTGKIENTGHALAFQVQLAVTKGTAGEEASPAYWSDNYFMLWPGEAREISVRIPANELGAARPTLRLEWWNQ
jgi:exo-1,4-beta-D-glucosaminidase